MEKPATRDYSCKDEELPFICMFSSINLRRDLADFTAYSPIFTPEYVSAYDSSIQNSLELMQPQSETLEVKIITQRIRDTYKILIGLVNHLTGYIMLANLNDTFSSADFGIKNLRKSVAGHDVEGVMQALRIIIGNLNLYKAELQSHGMGEEIINRFKDSLSSLNNDKQKQVAILNNRRKIVYDNLETFNRLFAQLNEILMVGKILYKKTNPLKSSEYTFSELMKHVRKSKPATREQKVKIVQND